MPIENASIYSVKYPEGFNQAHYAALSENPEALDKIRSHTPDLLEQQDKGGLTIAHYTALSENPEAKLDWIQIHFPHLLEQQNKEGFTFAHFAIFSVNPPVLNWIKTRVPYFLEQILEPKDKDKPTIAHCIALRSSHLPLQALDLVQTHAPHLLEQKIKGGITIAHCAASSGNPAALNWINTHAPHLLGQKDNNDNTIVHHAGLSGNPACFNYALRCTSTPDSFSLKLKNDMDTRIQLKILNCINKALDTNFTLKTILSLPTQSNNEQITAQTQEIEQKLLRNQAISPTMESFFAFLIGYPQIMANKQAPLPPEILKIILEQCLPAKTPPNKVNQLLDKAYNRKETVLINRVTTEITRLQKRNPIINFLIALGILESADDKIRCLTILQESLTELDNPSMPTSTPIDKSLETTFNTWMQENKTTMEAQRNCLHTFFNSQHKPKSGVFLEKMKTEITFR
ncbi:hypothetical protein [Legionella fairfieldensis]|uniref:hypothetical protein n=1 Tax=Legionella fairfieldensis TaxID=45064 RepID=UPI00048BA790|nr:hypothetical protein [Legionella fairfieldensis]